MEDIAVDSLVEARGNIVPVISKRNEEKLCRRFKMGFPWTRSSWTAPAEWRRRFGGRGWFESGVDAPLCHRSPWGFPLRTFTGLMPLLFWGSGLPTSSPTIANL